MSDRDDLHLRHNILLTALGIYALIIVFLVPHPGSQSGHSFFRVAMSTVWSRWGDWVAAWCSIKIILLNLGCMFLLASSTRLLLAARREKLAEMVLVLSVVPCIGLWLGSYYLLKSLF